MPTPTVTKHSTRLTPGLTGKGRAYLALAQVRDRWHEFSDDQKAEVAELVARLSVAMRRENLFPQENGSRPLPLAARISA
jgi:hypothetical protein